MALSDGTLRNIWATHAPPLGDALSFARAIEAEVRRQDDALIRQLVAALSLPCDRWNGTQSRIVREAIDAANAWLEGKA